jgi:hypothetical protein
MNNNEMAEGDLINTTSTIADNTTSSNHSTTMSKSHTGKKLSEHGPGMECTLI